MLDTEGLITEAILMGHIEAAVELCMTAKKYTEAIILARTGMSYHLSIPVIVVVMYRVMAVRYYNPFSLSL